MVFARYTKSKKHKKLKSVDPSFKSYGQNKNDHKKGKKQLLKEMERIKNLSEQNVPKTIGRLFQDSKLKRAKRNSSSSLKVTTNMDDGDVVGATKPLKNIPKTLQQGPYESETSFLRRLDKLCCKVRSETKIEAKYNLGEKPEKDENKTTNRILRRRERDKKRKLKKKKNKQTE